MSVVGRMGFTVLAVVGVLAFFGPFDTSRAFGAAPVTVTNTPLPVRDADLQEIIRAGIHVADSKRDTFTVVLTLGENAGVAGANIVLPFAAIVETVAAACSPQILVDYTSGGPGSGMLTLQTQTGLGPNQITANVPSGVSNTQTLNTGLFGNWSLSPVPTGTAQLFMPPTAVGYPVGKYFTLYTWTPAGQEYTCSISVVVRYTQ
jgi:hypothetical protein